MPEVSFDYIELPNSEGYEPEASVTVSGPVGGDLLLTIAGNDQLTLEHILHMMSAGAFALAQAAIEDD